MAMIASNGVAWPSGDLDDIGIILHHTWVSAAVSEDLLFLFFGDGGAAEASNEQRANVTDKEQKRASDREQPEMKFKKYIYSRFTKKSITTKGKQKSPTPLHRKWQFKAPGNVLHHNVGVQNASGGEGSTGSSDESGDDVRVPSCMHDGNAELGALEDVKSAREQTHLEEEQA